MNTRNEEISFKEYCAGYYKTGIVLSGRYYKKPAKPLNKNQLKTYYEIHIRKIEYEKQRLDKKKIRPRGVVNSQTVRDECLRRDGNRCRLMALLKFNETKELLDNADPSLLRKLDAAHVFGKAAHPKMRYLADNVVMLNRVSHNWLDQQKSPINGKPISLEEKIKWWQRIVGKNKFNKLLEMSKGEIVEWVKKNIGSGENLKTAANGYTGSIT